MGKKYFLNTCKAILIINYTYVKQISIPFLWWQIYIKPVCGNNLLEVDLHIMLDSSNTSKILVDYEGNLTYEKNIKYRVSNEKVSFFSISTTRFLGTFIWMAWSLYLCIGLWWNYIIGTSAINNKHLCFQQKQALEVRLWRKN